MTGVLVLKPAAVAARWMTDSDSVVAPPRPRPSLSVFAAFCSKIPRGPAFFRLAFLLPVGSCFSALHHD